MKRQFLFKLAGVLTAIFVLCLIASCENQASTSEPGKEIYEWRAYTLTGDGTELDNFYKNVLIPAYNRKGITVGAFKLFKEEEQEMRHFVFIYPDICTYREVSVEIWNDVAFTSAAQGFFDATAPKEMNLYTNFETYLSEAFCKIPVHRKPDSGSTLFEIRIYWSPNEEANKRKVKMFNEDEIDIFDDCGINSVFYGDILAGPKMPALLYLTWYKDEPTRTEAWRKFGGHPEWKRIRGLQEYANTATNNASILLSPMPYSQL
jgi:hypothetical protein